MFVCPFSLCDLACTGVCIAAFNFFKLEYMYECAVYLFLAQLCWVVLDIPRAWIKMVEDGVRDE